MSPDLNYAIKWINLYDLEMSFLEYKAYSILNCDSRT